MTHPIMNREQLLQEIRERLGGHGSATTLARIRGVSIAAAAKWLRVGIPRSEVGIVSNLTGLPPHVIRPDEFLPPVEANRQP